MSALLEVSGVSVSFDGFKAITNLSFAIGPTELRAIIGPNGAGKTTFMDIVTGKTKPDSGTVLWGEKGQSLLSLSEAAIARAGIGRKFQRPTVFEDQSVSENLILALKSKRGPLAALGFRLSNAGRQRVMALAQQVGLGDHLARKAGELSHGQNQSAQGDLRHAYPFGRRGDLERRKPWPPAPARYGGTRGGRGPAGADDLSLADGAGKSGNRLCRLAQNSPQNPR